MNTKTKDAKDGAEFEAYPVHSMAVLWSMDAHKTNDAPLDGDALARGRYQALRLDQAWIRLDAAAASRLRNNHHEIDRNNR